MKSIRWFVANWKMNVPYNSVLHFAITHRHELTQLSADYNRLIICPSATALNQLSTILESSPISVGAQDCSAHQEGNFTGELSATDLKEAGATFCIIGHAERRQYHHETNEVIVQKLTCALQASLMPIICVGEHSHEHEKGNTIPVLEQQLLPVIELLNSYPVPPKTILIAYEPVWAIGTGKTPCTDELTSIFAWLKKTITTKLPTLNSVLLYGGSVNPENIPLLCHIEHLDGFLVGAASTDFVSFKKIITLSNQFFS